MSFRREVLRDIRGFDEALGSGTRACGAEETAASTLALLEGNVLVFRPTAFVWHSDRESYSELEKQFRDLGAELDGVLHLAAVERCPNDPPSAQTAPAGIERS